MVDWVVRVMVEALRLVVTMVVPDDVNVAVTGQMVVVSIMTSVV